MLNAKQHERRGRRSSRRPAARARSRSPPTWPVAAPTSCSAATPSSWPTRSCASRASTRSSTPRSTRPPGPAMLERDQGAGRRPSTTRSSTLGGLYVVGTERHESRRIDNQLRGRSGRQGDPGESRFYLSLRGRPDAAVQVRHGRLGAARRSRSPTTCRSRTSGSPARSPAPRARSRRRTSRSRKNVLKYDDVMNRQRQVIYGERREVLEGADLERADARHRSTTSSSGYVTGRHRGLRRGVGPRAAVDRARARSTRCRSTVDELEDEAGGRDGLDRDDADRGPQGRRPGRVRRAARPSSAPR